ncbi:unnamed protein product [Ilex paraguariensis]|uniref:Pentatricopeptide repeat-containing protein n=1 Tax=Ilex paraguariensis TaxID=185542 RepID=A0ABC8TM63_9AQUA
MSRSMVMAKLVRQISQLERVKVQPLTCGYCTMVRAQILSQSNASEITSFGDRVNNPAVSPYSGKDSEGLRKHQVGENVSRKDKISFLTSTLLELKDSKEAVYGALDAWVAWERNFPIGPLKIVLNNLEKEQQWHRVVQVIKWMLSKGQGTTMGTYGQLIRALDMDHRAQEAHEFWVKKIGSDLHSVPWQLCHLMISVYYRNNMLQNLVQLFKGLEAFDRKPPEKLIVQKVADAYDLLGLLEDKERVLEKYKDLFNQTWKGTPKKRGGSPMKRKEKSRQTKRAPNPDGLQNTLDLSQTCAHDHKPMLLSMS